MSMARTRAAGASPWAIPVAQIVDHPGTSHEINAEFPAPSGIGDAVISVREGTPVHVIGSIDAIVDGLVLSAHVSAVAEGVCSRCLTPIRQVQESDPIALFPYHAHDPAGRRRTGTDDAEVEIIAGQEESESTYPLSAQGAYADIEALLRDELTAGLPLKPLCRADCRGLCPQCGMDMNQHPDHRHEVSDIRWAALEGLKQQLLRETDDGNNDHRDERKDGEQRA